VFCSRPHAWRLDVVPALVPVGPVCTPQCGLAETLLRTGGFPAVPGGFSSVSLPTLQSQEFSSVQLLS